MMYKEALVSVPPKKVVQEEEEEQQGDRKQDGTTEEERAEQANPSTTTEPTLAAEKQLREAPYAHVDESPMKGGHHPLLGQFAPVETMSVGNVTHQETESVVSSWVDDDDCFFDSVQADGDRDVKFMQPQRSRGGADSGWREVRKQGAAPQQDRSQRRAQQGGPRRGGGPQQQQQHRDQQGAAGVQLPQQLGGRFDALAPSGPAKKRR